MILNLAEDKDIIYLTSFYAEYGYKTLLLKKEKKIQSPVVIASMGVFSKEALAQKSLKRMCLLQDVRCCIYSMRLHGL